MVCVVCEMCTLCVVVMVVCVCCGRGLGLGLVSVCDVYPCGVCVLTMVRVVCECC